ncbi:hypothetical protein QMK28_12705 [Streptomyces sp. H27-D2]|nr:hypothetical protein [Streptomyces sp. H27-D2]MEC4017152.1 hypothetical protein [Streptomyces sp. H27-D2]
MGPVRQPHIAHRPDGQHRALHVGRALQPDVDAAPGRQRVLGRVQRDEPARGSHRSRRDELASELRRPREPHQRHRAGRLGVLFRL